MNEFQDRKKGNRGKHENAQRRSQDFGSGGGDIIEGRASRGSGGLSRTGRRRNLENVKKFVKKITRNEQF